MQYNYYCVVPENIHTPHTEDSLICTPDPPGFSIPGGFDDLPTPASRHEFPVFLNRDFLRSSKIQSGFGNFLKKESEY